VDAARRPGWTNLSSGSEQFEHLRSAVPFRATEQRFLAAFLGRPLPRFVRTGGVEIRYRCVASRSGERAWSNARSAERRRTRACRAR
jgi:hypothetical protein